MRKNIMNVTIGIDLGDKKHHVCVLDEKGNLFESKEITNTLKAIQKYFDRFEKITVAMEAGTHSPWISKALEKMGHAVLVGNPRKLRAIWASEYKDDVRDAEMLARIARFDPNLMYPIHHRNKKAQETLMVLKARAALVKCRTQLINFVRGSMKAMGLRVPSCGVPVFHKRAEESVPEELLPALKSVIDQIEKLTKHIKAYDKKIQSLCETDYPETQIFDAITGVGKLTALTYILTLEDHHRFRSSRAVGKYLGLVPRRDQSGDTDKKLSITKAGDKELRRLLVVCSHYILGPFGSDCDLRRFGLKLAARGGKSAKRSAVVAVARKLAVLMHSLWSTGEVYEPLRNTSIQTGS